MTRLLSRLLRWLRPSSLPPCRDYLVMLTCGAGGLLLFSSSALADTIANGGSAAVTPEQVAQILGLIVSVALSASTLAYSAGILGQRVQEHERRLAANEATCKSIASMETKLDLLLEGRLVLPGGTGHSEG